MDAQPDRHEGGQTDRRKTLTAKTRFNARISSNRVTDTLIMELAEVKLIRKALNDVTINDISLRDNEKDYRKQIIFVSDTPDFYDELDFGARAKAALEGKDIGNF